MATWLRGETAEPAKPLFRQKHWVGYKPPPTRPQKRCPRCGFNTGIFLAACSRTTAMFNCAANNCSCLFEDERPEPMRVA